MIQFAQWFVTFFKQLVRDIADAFSSLFTALFNVLIANPLRYFDELMASSYSFGPLDWILAVVSVAVFIALYLAIGFIIFIFARKYLRFVRKEKDKESLLHQTAQLSSRISTLIDEKNAILALSGGIAEGQGIKRKDKAAAMKNRFANLKKVDERYNFKVLPAVMPEEDKLSLKTLTDRFINFSASQLNLYYPHHVIATFFAGMAMSKTMILEGISGTGKTSLPYAMGKFFHNDAYIISVQPSWRDRAEMLGYLNEFTKKYNESDFLKALYESTYRSDINIIVLDEMNLARVEYYFADFLSLLEMPHHSEWFVDIVSDQIPGDPLHLADGKLLIPQNVWFVGTANKDDSTFTITDKVYDRAASIEMNAKADIIDAPPTQGINASYEYLEQLFKKAALENKISDRNMDALNKLDSYITEKFQITFGNRIMKQINTFVPVYIACGGEELTGLDHMVCRKILRKFETLNLPFLQQELEELLILIDKLFGKTNFNQCRSMLNSYLKQI